MSLLDDGARGCKRIQDPGRMSARLHLAEEAGRAADSPDMSSGVCIMIKRHLSSCRFHVDSLLQRAQKYGAVFEYEHVGLPGRMRFSNQR